MLKENQEWTVSDENNGLNTEKERAKVNGSKGLNITPYSRRPLAKHWFGVTISNCDFCGQISVVTLTSDH